MRASRDRVGHFGSSGASARTGNNTGVAHECEPPLGPVQRVVQWSPWGLVERHVKFFPHRGMHIVADAVSSVAPPPSYLLNTALEAAHSHVLCALQGQSRGTAPQRCDATANSPQTSADRYMGQRCRRVRTLRMTHLIAASCSGLHEEVLHNNNNTLGEASESSGIEETDQCSRSIA